MERIAFGPFPASGLPLIFGARHRRISERSTTVKLDVENLVCAIKGHVTPAGSVAMVGPEDAGFGIDVHPTWRICRCARCDSWIGVRLPTVAERDRLPPLGEIDLPRRGKPLRQAVILRLIALDRGIHSVVFAIIAVLAFLLRSRLAGVQSSVRNYLETLAKAESQTGRANSHGIVAKEGTRILHLHSGTLEVLIITAVIYAVIEGAEAVGLWYEKRWAEYLTAVATVGFIPFEIRELGKRVTALRVAALVVNVAILIYLIYAKHLFGVGRARAASEAGAVDPTVFAPPF
jgi:uncharacterized membrane protein (DUF2068 family)